MSGIIPRSGLGIGEFSHSWISSFEIIGKLFCDFIAASFCWSVWRDFTSFCKVSIFAAIDSILSSRTSCALEMDPRAKETPNIAEIIASSKEDVPLEVRSSARADFFPDDPILSRLFGFSTDSGVFFFVIVIECKTILYAGIDSRHEFVCCVFLYL